MHRTQEIAGASEDPARGNAEGTNVSKSAAIR